ncbi:MAG: FliMN protein [Candidatus Brocadiaceae bacterium]|nr:FliMN protein [Candidatus Brocadiaceae bacterium]
MANAILKNEEVEALLAAIETGQVLVGQKVETKKDKKIQHYDFRRPDRFPREQKRRLQKISEEVAKAMGISLSRYLSASIVVELIAIEEFSYEVFVTSFTDIMCTSVLSLKPFSGLGCLTLDVGYCLAMVDRGLGGPGRIPQKIRPLTMIEEAVVNSVLLSVVEEVKICWLKIAHLDWKIEKIESDIKSLQIAPSTEVMISINFATSGDLGNGTIILCIPVTTLEMMMIKSKTEKVGRQEEIALVKNVLNNVELTTTVVLGTTNLSLNELINLKEGDVVRLDNKVNDLLKLEIEEKVKSYGKPGMVSKNLAFQVSSMI